LLKTKVLHRQVRETMEEADGARCASRCVMRLLFVHQNFPRQHRHFAARLRV
jgi:hypothetical protein